MHIELRNPSPEDKSLLLTLYAESRQSEIAAFQWESTALEAFLSMQFEARERAYRMQYPDLEDVLICCGEETAGRMMLVRTGGAIHIIDIAVRSAYRRKRVATVVIERLQDEARLSGSRVSLRVDASNTAAIALYQGLGFRNANTDGHLIEMIWKPDDLKFPANA